MSRIRSIKPDFFRHEALYEAEIEAGLPLRVAFAGLWTVADREGRFRWRPRELKLDCLPYDNLDFGDVLAALEHAGFILGYEVNRQRYGCIPSFHKHQVVNQRESPSKLPAMINVGPVQDQCTHMEEHVHAQDKHMQEPVHAQDKHCGEGEGEGEEEGEQDSDSSLRSESAPAAPGDAPAYTDAVHEVWQDGVTILQQLGVAERLARKMIGKWLKDTGNNDAQRVITAIRCAREKRTGDPIAFVTGALQVAPRHKRDDKFVGLQNFADRKFRDDLAEAA